MDGRDESHGHGKAAAAVIGAAGQDVYFTIVGDSVPSEHSLMEGTG